VKQRKTKTSLDKCQLFYELINSQAFNQAQSYQSESVFVLCHESMREKEIKLLHPEGINALEKHGNELLEAIAASIPGEPELKNE